MGPPAKKYALGARKWFIDGLRKQALAETDEDRGRLLLEYIANDNVRGVRSCIDRADLTVRDEEGLTPLHRAAALGSRTSVRLLIATGRCDHLIRDRHGRYASDLALEWARDYALARWLRRKQVEQAHRQGVPAWLPPWHRQKPDQGST